MHNCGERNQPANPMAMHTINIGGSCTAAATILTTDLINETVEEVEEVTEEAAQCCKNSSRIVSTMPSLNEKMKS